MADITKKVQKEVEEVVDILCDCCGKSCKDEMGEFQFMELKAYWGYGSNKDMTKWSAKVCEKCVDEKFSTMVKFQIMDQHINSHIE